jgi:hypothetical protein
MASDPKLVERVRSELHGRKGLTEKPMFGCAAFFVNGNLACAVRGKELLVRLDPAAAAAAAKEPGARPFEVSGRSMKSWVLVDPAKAGGGNAFAKWVARGAAKASSLPRK